MDGPSNDVLIRGNSTVRPKGGHCVKKRSEWFSLYEGILYRQALSFEDKVLEK